ncbi:MAG: hypothetical protein OEY49_05535 [Candidatus Heimdallarchaeota archaeon]|nr:hypothetical protein [Candidatus Heimdallarchaeota archaeon]
MMVMTNNDENDNLEVIAHKRALVMTLGNTRDLKALISMLEKEDQSIIKQHILVVLAALGKQESIPAIQQLIVREQDQNIIAKANEAISTIQRMSEYSKPF